MRISVCWRKLKLTLGNPHIYLKEKGKHGGQSAENLLLRGHQHRPVSVNTVKKETTMSFI